MTYAMADIHGCFDEYLEALEKIRFTEDDVLYVIGDCVDRGLEPMRLLQDMMLRPNVIPLLGNHDMTAYLILKQLSLEITEENCKEVLTFDFLRAFGDWMKDGGNPTLETFRALNKEQQEDILDYLQEFSLYQEVEAGGKQYLLVHGGLEPFDPDRPVEEYDIMELLTARPDYGKPYFTDKYTITGHTPTICEEGNQGTIIRRNGHIAIDCGCSHGYQLAVFCLETGEEFYVKAHSRS